MQDLTVEELYRECQKEEQRIEALEAEIDESNKRIGQINSRIDELEGGEDDPE